MTNPLLTVKHPASIHVEIAFGSGPQETNPAWAEIANVISIDVQRGRTSSTEAVQAGRATILVDNRERLYDPTNSDSYEYGDGFRIEPGKQIKIYIPHHQSITSGIPRFVVFFIGYVIGWYIEYTNDDRIPVVRIEAVDGLGYIGTRRLNISLPEQTVSERLEAILDEIEWPINTDTKTWRIIDEDQTHIAATTYTDFNALDAIQSVALAARGISYIYTPTISPREVGAFTYNAEYYRQQNAARTVVSEFQFGPPSPFTPSGYTGRRPYVSASFVYDRTEIYNEARITPASGVTQVAVGETVDNYFRNVYSLSVPLASNDAALQLAQKIINRYQYPRRRLERLTIGADVITSDHVGLDINRYIDVEISQHTGPSSPRRFFIEGVHHRIPSLLQWTMTFVLSPVEYYISWVIGSEENSLLGETTILG